MNTECTEYTEIICENLCAKKNILAATLAFPLFREGQGVRGEISLADLAATPYP